MSKANNEIAAINHGKRLLFGGAAALDATDLTSGLRAGLTQATGAQPSARRDIDHS